MANAYVLDLKCNNCKHANYVRKEKGEKRSKRWRVKCRQCPFFPETACTSRDISCFDIFPYLFLTMSQCLGFLCGRATRGLQGHERVQKIILKICVTSLLPGIQLRPKIRHNPPKKMRITEILWNWWNCPFQMGNAEIQKMFSALSLLSPPWYVSN